MSDASQERTYFGIVKTFHLDKGWGHIDCSETRLTYGKDIFFLRSQLYGTSVNRGDSVSFKVRQGAKGIEATDVCLSDNPNITAASVGGGVEATERFIGTIKSTDPSGKWGHITCEKTHAIYGKDMFLLRSEIEHGMLRSGVIVEFSVRKGLKGPEALDVKVLSSGGDAQSFEASLEQPSEAAQLSPEVGYFAAQQLAAGIAGVPPSQVTTAAQFTQAQASLAPSMHTAQAQRSQTRFSMVPPPMHQPQPQLSEAAMPMPKKVGLQGPAQPPLSEVTMPATSVLGRDTWPGASIDVATVAGGDPGYDEVGNKIFNGNVKAWNDQKGWGHLFCAETHSLYGKDMFMLRSSIKNGSSGIKVGDQVQFTVKNGIKGPEAHEVMRIMPSVRYAPY